MIPTSACERRGALRHVCKFSGQSITSSPGATVAMADRVRVDTTAIVRLELLKRHAHLYDQVHLPFA